MRTNRGKERSKRKKERKEKEKERKIEKKMISRLKGSWFIALIEIEGAENTGDEKNTSARVKYSIYLKVIQT